MNQLLVREKEKNHPTFGRKKMRKKLSLLFAVLMSLSVLVAGSGAASAKEDTSKLNLIKPGKLVVCMTLQFVPQMYLNDAGRPTGYDPDLVRKLARDLGLKLEIRNTDFTGLLAGIGSGQCDLASVGLGRNADREKSMTYVKEYMPYNTILAAGASDKTAGTTAAWNVAAKKITCLKGSVSCTKLTEIFPNATKVEFTTQDGAILEVASGRADGVILETAIFGHYNKNNPGTLKIAKLEKDINRYFGWWTVRLGNTALQTRLKDWICERQNSGWLASVYRVNMRQKMEPLPACTA
jgi:polar amino acid transport system substrate-binding protein